MGVSEKNRLSKNCPTAQQFADVFESKVTAVRKAAAGGSVTTELPPATEMFDHFQPCMANDVRAVIIWDRHLSRARLILYQLTS